MAAADSWMAACMKAQLRWISWRLHEVGLDTPTSPYCPGKMQRNNGSHSWLWLKDEPCKQPLTRTG